MHLQNSTSQEERFLEILEKHKKLVFKVANIYGRSSEDKKDLSQEIILQLWKSFPKFDDSYAISTWMYRIALNVSISFYRKERTRKKTYDGYQQETGSLLQWQEQPIVNQELQQLHHFINQLKSLDKALILLFLEGHKNKEIAVIMGMSVTNVSTKIHRIKAQLTNNFKSLKKQP
ncbi:MAG: RNA polymerase sigma factor [Chitinophagales bacterium]